MSERYQVMQNCFGFRNSYWEKGQIVEVEQGEKVPEYFKLLGEEVPPPQQPSKPKEPTTLSEIAKQEFIDEAVNHGIKEEDAKRLTQDELLIVLAKDTSRQKITAIIQKAKARQKK